MLASENYCNNRHWSNSAMVKAPIVYIDRVRLNHQTLKTLYYFNQCGKNPLAGKNTQQVTLEIEKIH